jgi:alpha-L-rhamnosidase
MRRAIFFIFYVVFISFIGQASNILQLTNLKCENLQNPLGIDKTKPDFSWQVVSNGNGTEQKAYQLMVASSPALLAKNAPDYWDSGKQESASSIWVRYNGTALNNGEIYYWKVRIWDESGKVSSWSQVSRFSIGLLSKDDWKALYISFPTEGGYRECPQLKSSFLVKQTGNSILLYINSLGFHEVYVNGKKVENGVLSSAVSQFNKRSWVLTYDITSLVNKGQNELLLWLGSGWYTPGLPGVSNDGPVVKAQVESVKKNKREILLVTDGSWHGRKSGYTREGDWRSHRFGGDIVNGTWAKTDLLSEKNEGRDWASVNVVTIPEHEVSPQVVEQNKMVETIHPENIKPIGKDTFLVDMGKALTGWFEIQFPKLEKNQVVVLEYSDHLDQNGKFAIQRQTDRYIASGLGLETFKNKFNYHGFRYVRIVNLSKSPDKQLVKAFLVRTGFESASGFQCSDQDLNKIHDMIRYTLQCLSIGGDLVDCPTLERLGYGGDGNASTLTAQTMYNLDPLYRNWLQAWADCIRDDGSMPHTAPSPYSAGGGPYWCGFIITASWKTYQNYGDRMVLEKYYPVMQKWLGYVDKYSVDGLLKPWPETDYRSWYLGDWATPAGIDQKAEASVNLVNNCFISVCLDNMQKIAKTLGKDSDASEYEKKNEALKKLIHQQYYHAAEHKYGTGVQIDLAYPLLAKVVPANLTDAVRSSLIQETMVNQKGHVGCGLVGIPVLTEWCTKNHEIDLLCGMLKKQDYPGYLFMINSGGTTTWEMWNGERSRIHNCYNGIGSWFYQALGGIRMDDQAVAYQKVVIDPQIPKGITWVKAFKETPYGKLSVKWQLINGNFVLIVEIPVGVEAYLKLPSETKEYRLNGQHINATGVDPVLKSGRYQVEYSYKQ